MSQNPNNFSAGPWKEICCDSGVRIVEIPDFRSFMEFVDRGFGDLDTRHVWRGQRDSDWKIVSSLKRTGQKEWDILQQFRRAVARCTQIEFNIDGKDDSSEEARMRLWSLGQHHGLFTPLIDWTIYPFVALFFAFAEDFDDQGDRAVFALNLESVDHANFAIARRIDAFKANLNSPPFSEPFRHELSQNYGGNFNDEDRRMIEASQIPHEARKRLLNWERSRLEKRKLKRYTSRPNENPRIHGQGGLHIYTPEDVSVEEWIAHCAEIEGIKFFGNVLTKLVVPNSERISILRSLNKMNINFLSLFPDFAGAALHCNLALKARHRFGLREY